MADQSRWLGLFFATFGTALGLVLGELGRISRVHMVYVSTYLASRPEKLGKKIICVSGCTAVYRINDRVRFSGIHKVSFPGTTTVRKSPSDRSCTNTYPSISHLTLVIKTLQLRQFKHIVLLVVWWWDQFYLTFIYTKLQTIFGDL